MQIYIVYKITNLVNNKYYIGVHRTDNINDKYMGSGIAILNALKKYGVSSFKKETIDIFFDEKNAYKKEALLVTEKEASCRQCYNIKPGGFGGFSSEDGIKGSMKVAKLFEDKNSQWYQQRSELASISLKKKWLLDGHPWNGRKHIKETKNKMKTTHKKNQHQQGSKNSQYGKRWINNGKEVRVITKDDPIPDGWQRGRKIQRIQRK